MRPLTVVVAHCQAMVAEGVAAGLARYPQLVVAATLTSAPKALEWAERADALAVDQDLSGAEDVARRFRKGGGRVVFLGEGIRGDGSVRVPLGARVSALAGALLPGIRAPRDDLSGSLTPRERQILGLVARGLAGKQVARHLGISPKTVEQHKSHIYVKLGVPNQAAAVSVALAGGLGRSPKWSQSST